MFFKLGNGTDVVLTFWILCCRLAVIFLVIAPLVLWIWSLIEQKGKEDGVKRIMFGYWQVIFPGAGLHWTLPSACSAAILQSWHISWQPAVLQTACTCHAGNQVDQNLCSCRLLHSSCGRSISRLLLSQSALPQQHWCRYEFKVCHGNGSQCCRSFGDPGTARLEVAQVPQLSLAFCCRS